jgi:hypothetical protein
MSYACKQLSWTFQVSEDFMVEKLFWSLQGGAQAIKLVVD